MLGLADDERQSILQAKTTQFILKLEVRSCRSMF